MFDRLKGLLEEGAVLQELKGLRTAVERVATALELQNAHNYPTQVQPTPTSPAVTVSYTDDLTQAELMEIELGLTAALGMPPTEEEVLTEWDRRHPAEG